MMFPSSMVDCMSKMISGASISQTAARLTWTIAVFGGATELESIPEHAPVTSP